jgi:hypothetical protein
MVWIEWERLGKDALVIQAGSAHSPEWMARTSPLISDRAAVLNWSERKGWDRWSLPVRMFWVFGPHGLPEQFTKATLPSVIVFRQLRQPKTFTFGTRAEDREKKIEELRAELLDLDAARGTR